MTNNRKIVSNSFNNGIDLDSNPMVVSNDCLTNCLNGTLITHNGNEFVLLNDMGNGKVESASLPSGYVPLGIKEHGGIVYVASKNITTGDCLIGSFPSPERNIESNEFDNFEAATVTSFDDFISDSSSNRLNGEINTDVLTKRIYPNSLKPGDSFYVSIPSQSKDPFLTHKLGIKAAGGIEVLNTNLFIDGQVPLGDGSFGIPNTSTTINKEDYWNYDGKNTGELYMMTSINLPPDIDVSYKVSSTNVVFTIESDIILKEGERACIWYNDSNNNEGIQELTTGTLLISTKYTTTVSVNINKDAKYVTLYVAPVINRNDGYYKVKRLQKEVTVDIEAELSGDVSLTLWRYHYDEENNVLELTYGFSGASSVSEITFDFCPYIHDYDYTSIESGRFRFDTEHSKKVVAESRRSYSGLFTDLIRNDAGLVKWNLYLCKIEGKKIVIDESGNESTVDITPMYRIVWTNDLLNNYNTSQAVFDSATLDFLAHLEVTSDFESKMDSSGKLLGTEQSPTPSSAPSAGFSFTREYEDVVSLTTSYEIIIPKLVKLNAFGYNSENYRSGDAYRDSDVLTTNLNASLKNKMIELLGEYPIEGNIEILPHLGSEIKVKSTYLFASGYMQVELPAGTAGIISNYFDATRESRNVTPRELLFGNENGIPYALGIGASKNVSAKKDLYRTYYGFFDITQTVAKDNDFPELSKNLADNSSCKWKDIKYVDRDWLNDMSPKITNWLKSNTTGEFLPTFSCIASCRKKGSTYGGDWVNKTKDNKKNFIGYEDIDYPLYFKNSSRADAGSNNYPYSRNYIIPLWLNYETDAPFYYILIDSTALLDTAYGLAIGECDDDGHANNPFLNPQYGKSITGAIETLFAHFYVLDPQETILLTTHYYKADINNYAYNNSITATLELEETVNLTDGYSIQTEFSNISAFINRALTNTSATLTQIDDRTGVQQVNVFNPDGLVNTHSQEITKKNIAKHVNDYLNPIVEDKGTFASYVIRDMDATTVTDTSGKDGRNNSLSGREIYYKADGKYYPLSNPHDNNYVLKDTGIKVSLLKELKAVNIKINKLNYTLILVGKDMPKISSDYGATSYNTTYALLPHIGCLVTLANGSLKNGDLFPFSFIKGYNASGSYSNNYLCCLLLHLNVTNHIKTSK